MEASSSKKVELIDDNGTLLPKDKESEEDSLRYGSQGLIAAGPQRVNQSGLPARSSSRSSDGSSVGSSLLTRNLLSLLERPNFLESPLPRWTAPPQWLQFQLLRNDDEGLIFDETVNQSAEPQIFRNEPNDEQVPTRIEQNLRNLLQNQSDLGAPQQMRSSAQWQVPGPVMQSAYQEATIGSFGFPIRLPVSVMKDYAEGLIMAPPRVNDPSSTPSLTCNFGLMQHIGYGERKLEFFPEVFGAVDAPFFANRLRSQAFNTADLLFLIITDWQPWFERALREALPDFPMQTLLQFNSPQAASMLPSIDYNEGGKSHDGSLPIPLHILINSLECLHSFCFCDQLCSRDAVFILHVYAFFVLISRPISCYRSRLRHFYPYILSTN